MTGLEFLGPFANLGGWLIVVLMVVLSMIRGWLISASQIEKLIAIYELLLKDKDNQIENWRQAFHNSDARGDILAENQRELTEAVRTTNNLIQALSTYYPPLDKREPVK